VGKVNPVERQVVRELVVATRNPGKLREIQGILSSFQLKILSLQDFPQIPPPAEDGMTFADNAAKKALEVARKTERFALADDSGLVVEALQGRPGVFSARYAGENATDEQRVQKILSEMANVSEERRQAAFVCAVALASPDGRLQITEAECRGRITFSPRGKGGFGYDPIFFVPEFSKTMAELSPDVKNRISHRGRALKIVKRTLPAFLEGKKFLQ
jgi:XTP/dITP diphosphohydrolase